MDEAIQALIDNYGNEINTNYRNPQELINYISNKYAVALVENGVIELERIKERFILNFENSLCAKGKDKIPNSWFIRIERDERSKVLYSFKVIDLFEGSIFVLIDSNTGYFYTNSRYLTTQIVEYVGVTKEDVDNTTFRYLNYLMVREQLDTNRSLICDK